MLTTAPHEIEDQGAIRSVAKAFALLETLCACGSASIGKLSERAALPKPTVVRMVRTLVQCGYVRQTTPRGDYCVTSKLDGLGAGFHGLPAVIEASMEVTEALTAEILWPVAVATPEDGDMVVRYSTLSSSPHAHTRPTFNKHLSMATSAHGRAWMAYLDPAAPMDEGLRTVRERGYALRTGGGDPMTNTLAVPVLHHGRPVATLGMTFFCRAVLASDTPGHAERLKRAAQEIADRFAAATRR